MAKWAFTFWLCLALRKMAHLAVKSLVSYKNIILTQWETLELLGDMSLLGKPKIVKNR